MRKREELSSSDTCMSHAHPDEMVFVLIGRDPSAPEAIRTWVDDRVGLGKNVHTDVQIVEALAIARTMELEGRRWVDAPETIPFWTQAELIEALAEAIKLMSHYATLLNGHDGGKRAAFPGISDWLRRLRDINQVVP